MPCSSAASQGWLCEAQQDSWMALVRKVAIVASKQAGHARRNRTIMSKLEEEPSIESVRKERSNLVL
eukprot:jgi/Chlat1/4613/Chrsp293S04364